MNDLKDEVKTLENTTEFFREYGKINWESLSESQQQEKKSDMRARIVYTIIMLIQRLPF